MTSLPPPEQWVLCKMNEMEVAEMIEGYIDYYTVDEDGTLRSVHLPTPFVRHFMQRHDGALPTVVAIATAPIVLADGVLLAPEGLDRERGIQFLIQDELRAWRHAASTSASTLIALTPRTGRSSTRTRWDGRRNTAPRYWPHSTPSC